MKRISALLLGIFYLLICCFPAFAGDTLVEQDAPVAQDITINAYAAIVIDMDTGEALYEYDADEQNYPASTTKIMTAYLCLKYGDPNDTVTVSESAFSDISERASTGGLEVGETMTVHRLLQALLVVSASEAANVIGEYISGTHEAFVDLMNEEAQALGCTGTHFANCHGLPNSNHYTTARDLAKIAAAAMEYEEFRDIVGSAITTMEATNKHSVQTIRSTNGLLPGSSYTEYNYPYAIGIKTGHTNAAGYCLVSAADKDGTRLLCVLLGASSRISSFAQSISLYDWAYDNYEALTYGLAPESIPEAQEPSPEPTVTATPTPAPTPTPTVEPTVAPTVTPEPSPEVTATSKQSLDLSIENLTGPMLPVVICFVVVLALVLVLIVLVIIVILRRKN
jgi:D-alanyl-D-alanine carboxypeptidase (penicillin-binding protein 5/6)